MCICIPQAGNIWAYSSGVDHVSVVYKALVQTLALKKGNHGREKEGGGGEAEKTVFYK